MGPWGAIVHTTRKSMLIRGVSTLMVVIYFEFLSRSQPSNSNLGRTIHRPRACTVAVENKADYHYEVIESTIMRYPLPWHEWNCSKHLAIFDVALTQHDGWARNELEPWKFYFEKYLSGKTRERTIGDGAVVRFGTIQNYQNYSHRYDAYIGVSCDSFDYRQWMSKGPQMFCVLHGTPSPALPVEWDKRVAWLNPMFPRYFIPSDFPHFPPPKLHRRDKIRLCIKGIDHYRFDSSYRFVTAAVSTLDDPSSISLQIMGGRSEIISPIFKDIDHLVNITRVNEPDFYKFEEKMSQCHILLPLLHPWDEIVGENYFPSSKAKKLSGFISQAIGLKLPVLVHEGIHDVYKNHWTAKVWTYSSRSRIDVMSFIGAFKEMVLEIRSLVGND
ncbi:hypothetical protein ACHAXS_004078 [Conticribra weissflogii]